MASTAALPGFLCGSLVSSDIGRQASHPQYAKTHRMLPRAMAEAVSRRRLRKGERELLLALRDRLWQAINDHRGSNRGDLDGLPREASALVIRY